MLIDNKYTFSIISNYGLNPEISYKIPVYLTCFLYVFCLSNRRKTQCRVTLNRLLEAEEITSQKAQQFQQAALASLVRAVECARDNLPLKDALLKHARFVDVQLRAECGVEDALYFVDRQGKAREYNIF